MKRFFLLLAALLWGLGLQAQYATKHHIAPSPWPYWSDANEIVVSTKEPGEIEVQLKKSDGSFITTFSITSATPVAYRFEGNPTFAVRNEIGITYADRGLIVEADAPVLVNLRNIASDAAGTGVQTVKGNASLVSFGNEGAGTAFRLGYYRSNYSGLSAGMPIYTVMALEENTTVNLNDSFLVMLNAGESHIFTAEMGALLTADKPVVANTGSYGDTPQACGGSGQDGTVDQVAPVNRLGMQYLLVRGSGTPGTVPTYPEQSTIIASEPNTIVQIMNYDAAGNLIGTAQEILADAGSFVTIFHGDTENPYSLSFISADSPVVIYSANAVECETDVSTVLPVGGCSGAVNIITKKFVDYEGNDLPYFGYTIVESATEPVLINGANMESVTGIPRVAIGDTGFYMLRFTNMQIGNPENIIITSVQRLTTSIIQQGIGFSMSAFFSAFSNTPDPAEQIVHENCAISLSTTPGYEPYAWYLDGILLPGETGATITVAQTGNYSVSATAECGTTPVSAPVYATVWPPVLAGTPGNMVQCLDEENGNIFDLSTQDSSVLMNQSIEDFSVSYHVSEEDAAAGINGITETMVSSNQIIYARVANKNVDCYALSFFNLIITAVEVDMPDEYSFCKDGIVNITAPDGFMTYNWSTGETGKSVILDEAGTVYLTVTQDINGLLCESTKEILVIESSPATISEVLIDDWSYAQNTITIVPGSEGNFEFSINGFDYQDSPLFYNLIPGPYTVYARDKSGCGSADYEVYLLMYPNFFTPNGDGVNESWKVHYAYLEPEMLVHIFDRYGKLITVFNGNDGGWDGTYNGANLPSTDYWFVVKRADGKMHKGHFSLKR